MPGSEPYKQPDSILDSKEEMQDTEISRSLKMREKLEKLERESKPKRAYRQGCRKLVIREYQRRNQHKARKGVCILWQQCNGHELRHTHDTFSDFYDIEEVRRH